MRDETRSWILQADKDLGTASFALNSVDGPLPVTTSLHCQQAAEKYLKAYLQEHGTTFSEHDMLTSLFDSCMGIDESFGALRSDIDQLAGYSIATRYPQESDSLAFRKEAVATATHVQEFVLRQLA